MSESLMVIPLPSQHGKCNCLFSLPTRSGKKMEVLISKHASKAGYQFAVDVISRFLQQPISFTCQWRNRPACSSINIGAGASTSELEVLLSGIQTYISYVWKESNT